MINDYELVMTKKSDAQLLSIVQSKSEDYLPDALEAAKQELNKRNLSEIQISAATRINAQRLLIAEIKSHEPLDIKWKIISFLCPGVMQIIFAATYRAEGYERKANELSKWSFFGIGFYALIIFSVFILQLDK